ncbi:zinc finger protein 185 [Xyrichtys novacula]|uniref:Zinc finger protein 185 n=1 Tax=Xyrichtys novacula TaxID=13765 RepID=A0AAV1FBG7_XYRNO|nr:zinc finger protein 185 [Xyrichtys novacula]
MSKEGDKSSVFRTTKVRTRLRDDNSWLQRRVEPEADTEEDKPWLAEVRARINGAPPETSPVSSPTKPTPPPTNSDPQKAPSGFMIRGIFHKLDKPDAPTNPPSTNGLSGTTQFTKKPSESYKKIAPYTVKPTLESQENQLSPEEQEKRTEAASSVLKKSAGRQRSYVLSAAKKFESKAETPEAPPVDGSLAFVAKRVEISEDDESAATPAPVISPPSNPVAPITSASSAPQPKLPPKPVDTSVPKPVEVKADQPEAPKTEEKTAVPEPVKEDPAPVPVPEKDPFEGMKPGCTKVDTPLPELLPQDVKIIPTEPEPEDTNKVETPLVDIGPAATTPASPPPTPPAPVPAVPLSPTPVSPLPVPLVPLSPTPAPAVPLSPTLVPPAQASAVPLSPTPVSPTPVPAVPLSPTPAPAVPLSSTLVDTSVPKPVDVQADQPAAPKIEEKTAVPEPVKEDPAPAPVSEKAPAVPLSPTPVSPTPAPVVPLSPTPVPLAQAPAIPLSPTPVSPTPAPAVPLSPTPATAVPLSSTLVDTSVPKPVDVQADQPAATKIEEKTAVPEPVKEDPAPAPISEKALAVPLSPTPVSATAAPAVPLSPTQVLPAQAPAVPLSPTPVSPTPAPAVPLSPTPVSAVPLLPTPVSPAQAPAVPLFSTPISPTPAPTLPLSPTPVSPTPAPAVPLSTSPVSPTTALSVPLSPTPVVPAGTPAESLSPTLVSPTPAPAAPLSPPPVPPPRATAVPLSPTPVNPTPDPAVPLSPPPVPPPRATAVPRSPPPVLPPRPTAVPLSTTPVPPAQTPAVPLSPTPVSPTPTPSLPKSPPPVLSTPLSPVPISSELVSAVTAITVKKEPEVEPEPEPEPSLNLSSGGDTLNALSDTLISLNPSSTSLQDDESEQDLEEGGCSHIVEDSDEEEPTPDISDMTEELLPLTDGPKESTQTVPLSPGRWGQDLLGGLDSEWKPTKTSSTLGPQDNDVIVRSVEIRSLSMQPEEEKPTVETAKETQSSTETVTVTTKTVIITDKSEEDSADPWSSRVKTTRFTESSSADPFDPYPIGTTSPNRASDLLQPRADISINRTSTTYTEKKDPTPDILLSKNALGSLADDITSTNTDTNSLRTPRSWAHTWDTSTTRRTYTEESRDTKPEVQAADENMMVKFERKSKENDSPWDRWTSPTVYTYTSSTGDGEGDKSTQETHTVSTITTIRERYSEPEPVMDRYGTYTRTVTEEQRVPTPEPETKKGFVYLKEYVNATELSLHNARDTTDGGLGYLTSSSANYSYSSPSSGSLSSACNYCGKPVGNDAKISIEHLNINCHPSCFKVTNHLLSCGREPRVYNMIGV